MQRLSQIIALSCLLLAAMPALAQETSTAQQPAININTASAEQLETLPGIGTSRAADIVADREANGDYSSAEDLMRVNGIGEATVDGMRNRLNF
ncbi:MAG: ComEA family DNA-binding protein [Onishia taeanensis]|uniref:Competence protein ComEA n=1 Tax=Onishia taeanensis TaxID=284577 RepID=A0A328XP02_9GAMM|nr:ComEA family DNA-binding protein [Halomonas sp. I5-271120]RAR61536.1 competence protein ComEA [Halomonas taeanensis]